MQLSDPTLLGFVISLGIGLLIGIDRERRKGESPAREAAGVRTYTITALAGAAAGAINSDALMAAVAVGVVGLAGLSYWRSSADDPGLTGEIALVTTALLGMLTMSAPTLAAGAGVVVAVLLYSREGLHRFVRSSLSEAEMRDALIFAGATLVVLPLLPDDPLDPYGVLNLRKIWIVVVLIMAISGGGYIAVRLLGARFGLPVSGFASGFVSSSATIAAMASRVKDTPSLLKPAAAGAVLSTVATIVQLALLLAAVNVEVLAELAIPLALGGLAAVLYGGAFTLWALKHEGQSDDKPGRAFSLAIALTLAATLAVILVASAALQSWLGQAGVVIAAGTAGFADTHSAAVSVASLATAERIDPGQAVLPILVAFSTNTVTKIVLALAGSRVYALSVVPGLVLVAAAAWAGAFLQGVRVF
ncbi:MAG: MgtC/SapB family protein [Proteobacteria bacterium]|nr:MgtC/SapB family protein [Pseudomonadota bacterium]